MAKITLCGNAAVVTSTLKLSDLKLVQKYKPDALTIFEGEGIEKEPVFMVSVTEAHTGGVIGTYGVTFASEGDEDAPATITTIIEKKGNGDVKEFLADQFAPAIAQLGKIEAALPAVVEEIKAERAAFINAIETL